jgi:hypothetical protein
MSETIAPPHEIPQAESIVALIEKHVEQKRQNPVLVGADGKRHRLLMTEHASGQLAAYEKKMLDWAGSPEHYLQDSLGLIFELFSQQLLQAWLKQQCPQTGLQIIPAPASFDFMLKMEMQRFGSSADLIVGSWQGALGETLDVHGLINCQLTGKNQTKIHSGLRVPVYSFTQKNLTSVYNLEHLLYLFNKANNPNEHFQSILKFLNHAPLIRFLKEQAESNTPLGNG